MYPTVLWNTTMLLMGRKIQETQKITIIPIQSLSFMHSEYKWQKMFKLFPGKKQFCTTEIRSVTDLTCRNETPEKKDNTDAVLTQDA